MAHNPNQTKYLHFQDDLIPGLPDDLALECLLRVPITSHPTLRLVSHQWNSTLSNPSFFSLRRRAGFAQNHVFLIQPQSPPTNLKSNDKEHTNCTNPLLYNLSLYNTDTQEWRCLAGVSIPTFSQCVVLPEIRKLVVLGGCDPVTLEPVSRVLVIDLVLGVWKEGSPMPVARSFFASAAAAPATVYVAGGHDGQKNALKSGAAYDVMADEWRELPSMAEERDECCGLLLEDGKFWVVSGYGTDTQGRFRPDAEVFDPERWGWDRVTGVWPHPGRTPKCTGVVAVEGGRRWWQVAEEEVREFEWDEKVWRRVDLGWYPKRVNGSCLIDMGNGKIVLMGNTENSGGGGEGRFILGRENEKKSWRWEHVEAPSRFLGFPFSATHILM